MVAENSVPRDRRWRSRHGRRHPYVHRTFHPIPAKRSADVPYRCLVRHLRSLRLMRRDAGWIHTLLEESENERMHLMTFMSMKQPSIWFRALVLGAQG